MRREDAIALPVGARVWNKESALEGSVIERREPAGESVVLVIDWGTRVRAVAAWAIAPRIERIR